jgi:prepilin signal peptidase PulO-like enzyme (type II secretory pathway)
MDYTLLIPLLLGWLSGWLVNYLADVLPFTHKFSRPVCPVCQTGFGWANTLLFRNCTNCGKRRSARTVIVQAVMTVAPVLIWIFPSPTLPFPLGFILLVYLAIVLVIDLEHRLILHPVSIAGAVLGLGIGIFLRGRQSIGYGIISTLLGGAAGFGIMLLFYFIGKLFVKRMSKRRGLAADEVALGFGDPGIAAWLARDFCLPVLCDPGRGIGEPDLHSRDADRQEIQSLYRHPLCTVFNLERNLFSFPVSLGSRIVLYIKKII